jgi:hypothetical protein
MICIDTPVAPMPWNGALEILLLEAIIHDANENAVDIVRRNLCVIEGRPQDTSHQPLCIRVFRLAERRMPQPVMYAERATRFPPRLQRCSYKRRRRDRKFENAAPDDA